MKNQQFNNFSYFLSSSAFLSPEIEEYCKVIACNFFDFPRCFCELANIIGFSEKASANFTTEQTLGMYRHIVRNITFLSLGSVTLSCTDIPNLFTKLLLFAAVTHQHQSSSLLLLLCDGQSVFMQIGSL